MVDPVPERCCGTNGLGAPEGSGAAAGAGRTGAGPTGAGEDWAAEDGNTGSRGSRVARRDTKRPPGPSRRTARTAGW